MFLNLSCIRYDMNDDVVCMDVSWGRLKCSPLLADYFSMGICRTDQVPLRPLSFQQNYLLDIGFLDFQFHSW
jgi:hypothetical protein